MSKTFKDSPKHKQQRTGHSRGGRQRNISVRAVRRDPPDLRKLGRALIQLAVAQAEAEAQGQAQAQAQETTKPSPEEATHD
jgi:hypothetical protein